MPETTLITNPLTVPIHDLGELHEPKTLMFRVEVGTAQGPTPGNKYEMTVSAGDYSPIIRSQQTGKWFTLSWQDILALAVTKGIDLN